MHSNTKSETMKIASQLIKLGADNKTISKSNFKTIPVKKLKLMGEVLANAEFDINNQSLISGVTQNLFNQYQATSEDLTGVSDFLNSIPEAKYTVLYTEDNQGNVKASLRTQHDQIDVAKVAENFGGGGHKKAAGYRVPGRLKKTVRWEISTPVQSSIS
jgi:phosphoesterase RecJ-like protein